MQQLRPIWRRLIVAVTEVDSDVVRARNVKDKKILRARLGTRAWHARMTELVTKTKAMQRNLIEESTVPALLTNNSQLASSHHVTEDALTSTQCNRCVRCVSTVQSKHFSIHPSLQSLHLMVPLSFPHVEQLVCLRKSPSLSCRNASSKKASLNLSHSNSRSWKFEVRMYCRDVFEVWAYSICCIPFPLCSSPRRWANFLWQRGICFTVTTSSCWIWNCLCGEIRSWFGWFKCRR